MVKRTLALVCAAAMAAVGGCATRSGAPRTGIDRSMFDPSVRAQDDFFRHVNGAWLGGNGCVPIHNLMEDAATAEISRSQVWQWIRTPKGVLDDGRRITADMVRQFVPEELAKIKAGGFDGKFDRAAEIFTQMSTQDDFAEFLTLPLYEEI